MLQTHKMKMAFTSLRTKALPYLTLILWLPAATAVIAAAPVGRSFLAGQVPAAVTHLSPVGILPGTNQLSLSIGLPLRNVAQLQQVIADLYNPASPNFHHFLSSQEFTTRFGPTEQDYAKVKAFAHANGLSILDTYSNRLVLEVKGDVSNIESAFAVTLNIYRHPSENRNFYAPDVEPSVPTNLPVADLWGLSDFSRPIPLAHRVAPLTSAPLNYNGSGPGGSYRGTDFRNAYAAGSSLTGTGQIIAMAEFDGYYSNDIASYVSQSGYPSVTLQNVLVNNVTGLPGYSGQANAVAEVSLDIELGIAMAPGVSKVMVYEGSSPYTVFNQIASDNIAKQVSCSWAWNVGPTRNWGNGKPGSTTLDAILSQMVAQGQAFFQASGDSDAYTGSQALNASTGPVPVDSIYVTSVGGTTLTMSGSGSAWSSETVWNWGNNVGSGGGISPNYAIPSWQANVSMAANSGSTVNRNIPDVAMTADAVYVIYNNGSTGYFGGTSCAAPLWAGFAALVNQQSVASSGTTVGFLNPALYAIAAGNNYANCFHDIQTGNNIGTNTPGLFHAVANYDLASGLGTPNGMNLINALAPSAPYFLTEPASQTVASGSSVVLEATASGSFPLSFQWQFNGVNLAASANVSGVTSNILNIVSATTNNSGNYRLVVNNSYGAVTSSIAVLNVGTAPGIATQPASQTVLSGSNAVFSATATGSMPLVYQWRKDGSNLANGGGVSGATSNVLTLSGVTTNSSGNYTLAVTNGFGAVTSSVATLAVVLRPAIISSTLTNQTVQCGTNHLIFSLSAAGTSPLKYQWSLDGTAIAGATNNSVSFTNLHLPNHVIAVAVTNLYGSLESNAVITVLDTLAPVITLNSTNPYYVELGDTFADPGAVASDACAGTLPVVVSGTVNTSTVGTNLLIYTATDGNGNTNTATRTVIVRDATPPIVSWSFTNLVLAADTNCDGIMPDVTGTNFIQASDLSGTLIISQTPTNQATLPLGTNEIVISVMDSSGNTTDSTNQIIVQDQTPPVILAGPQSQTNSAGSAVTFSSVATACTPVTFQWYFNQTALVAATNFSLTLSNLTTAQSGDYFVVATADGGSSTSSVATLTVNLAASSLSLASSENPSGYRDRVDYIAGVSPTNATGSIEFFTNGVHFATGNVTPGLVTSTNLSALPRGTNLLTAIYLGDANYLPSTNRLLQIVTNHPPMAASAAYTLATNLALSISLTGLATNWTDADGDVISLAAVSTSTNGITLTNTGTALFYSNSNNVPDQFTCTISDGWGGTNFQTVSIAPAPSPVSTPLISGVTLSGDGNVQLSLGGAAGDTYVLETTTNLLGAASWLPLATNTLGTNGVWQFSDSQATNFSHRFYRLKLLP